MKSRTIPQNILLISSAKLSDMGYSNYMIRKLAAEGHLKKLNNKYYENTEYTGNISDFSYIEAYVPKGVVCLLSAASFYGLTTYLPDSIDVAIERDMKVSTLPQWPNIHITYYSKDRYETGVSTASDGTCEFKIYDIEKTVADSLYYRNKIGIEETKEILKNYLSRSDRNLVKLRKYANKLGCSKILSTYMEVLL